MTFGEALRQLMDERGIGVRALAREVPCDAGHMSKVCNGHKGVSERTARRLDEILDAGGQLVALARTTADEDDPAGTVGGTNTHNPDEDDEMQRRTLLQALAALGVTSAPAVEAIQHIRFSVDRAIGGADDRHLDDWEETVAEYGYAYTALPPHRLLKDLAADLVAVQQSDSRSTAGRLPAWHRVTGGLAALMAKTLSNLGEPRLARDWWRTAQHAADTSGDRDLALWVSGERLMHGLYDGRPPMILLRTANQVVERTSAAPCRGLADVRSVRAQLLALNGPAGRAEGELRACEEIFEQLPAKVTADTQSVAGWAEDRVRYTEAWVYAHTGDRDRLDASVARAKEVLPADDPRIRVQLDLLRAAGHVRAGDATEGVRHAQAVYRAQPVEHRTAMVTSLARRVADAAPADDGDAAIITAYRELLDSDSERRAIT